MIQDPGPRAIFDLFLNTDATPFWYVDDEGISYLAIGSTDMAVLQRAIFEVACTMHDAVVQEVSDEGGEIGEKTSQPFYDLLENLLTFGFIHGPNGTVIFFPNIPKEAPQ
jgi:hypothetical protein